MKKIIILTLAVFAYVLPSGAWGNFGHRIVIQVAERHLKKTTKENLAKYFSYDIVEDASWMDRHRKDPGIDYTDAWHVCCTDTNGVYDPMPRVAKGDCVRALQVCTYNLSHYRDLPDSQVVYNVRILIHMVGDMHCPSHTYIGGVRNFWECSLPPYWQDKTFHGFYDHITEMIYDGKTTDAVAELVDNFDKMELSQVCKGTFEDWVSECGKRNKFIYELNPVGTSNLSNDTVWRSAPLVAESLRNAGVRLATLLNKYFSN